MIDAAVQMYRVNGYHETSMDAIDAEARDLQADATCTTASKEDLFGAA